jgi:hypothetical protein
MNWKLKFWHNGQVDHRVRYAMVRVLPKGISIHDFIHGSNVHTELEKRKICETYSLEVFACDGKKTKTVKTFCSEDKETVLKEAQAFVDSKNSQSVWKHAKDRIKFYFAMYDEI